MSSPDYSKVWASDSSLTPYEFSDADYLKGWQVVGSIPPARTQFDALQRNNDLKAKDLNNRVINLEEHGATDFIIRQPSTTYAVGDVVYSPLLGAGKRLECVTAGTTSSGDLDATSSTTGGVIVDGGCTWLVVDITDGTPLGAVRGGLYLPLGYVKANGAEVLRADYPRLVRLADTYNLWTDDTANNLGKFGVGDGETTFVLPNWVDRMEQLSDTAGGTLEAGLPNITGNTVGNLYTDMISQVMTGAFRYTYLTKAGGSGTQMPCGQMTFDASHSNSIYGNSDTVQSPAIKMIPIMRY